MWNITLIPIQKLVLLASLTGVLVTQANAEPITQTYLSHNSTTAYVDVANMPYANPNAPKGGMLSLQASGTFNSAKPWMTTGIAIKGTNYLYDNLMSSSLDEAYTLYPLLAEKVTFDPDDKTWIIYHINPKATFWDGSTVTASDAKATFEALLTKGPIYIRDYLKGIKNIKTLDTQQVKFEFTKDANDDMLLTVGLFPVFKKSSIESDFETLNLTPLMGSGAYRLYQIDAGRSVIYKRDPNYWGRDVMINRGRFNFDFIKYIYFQNEEIAFEAFKAGQYQFREEKKSRNWASAYHFPAFNEGMVVKEQLNNRNPMAMNGLVMNLRRELFQDIRVRKALTLAFDFEWMNKALFYKQYVRARSYFYNSELEAQGQATPAEMAVIEEIKPLISPDQYQTVVNDWQLPETHATGYNRQQLLQARNLLLEAGFNYRNMQLYTPEGTLAKFEILLPAESIITRVVLSYTRALQRLGFEVTIRQVDQPQYVERLRNFDFDMVNTTYYQSLSPSKEQLSYWGSASADQIGNKNLAGVKNSAIDTIIDKLIQADERSSIILYSKVLDRLLKSGYYLVPMYNKTTYDVSYWQQYRHANPPSHAIGIDYWWVDNNAEQQMRLYLNK